MNELAVAARPQFDLSPQTFEQALTFANYLADSDMVPKDFKGKPGNCLIAMQWGAELGLKPLQALQNLAIINGRPSLWGDAVIALVRSSPACEYVIEEDDGRTATCKVKRRGEPEQHRTFSMDDAKAAGLTGKQGPWTQYPKRMRQMRARAFALRDVFPDVLRGLPVAEEIMDTPAEKHMGPVEVVQPAQPPSYPADKFDQNLPEWRKVIASGRFTADKIIAKANSVGPLTEKQKARIREAVTPPAQSGTPSADEVRAKLKGAESLDQLYEAADLIDSIGDDAAQLVLTEIFTARQAELENAS